MAGDFNAPDLKWNGLKLTNSSFNSEQLLEIIDEHGLTQLVKEPTRDDNILDLVLTNNVNIKQQVYMKYIYMNCGYETDVHDPSQ